MFTARVGVTWCSIYCASVSGPSIRVDASFNACSRTCNIRIGPAIRLELCTLLPLLNDACRAQPPSTKPPNDTAYAAPIVVLPSVRGHFFLAGSVSMNISTTPITGFTGLGLVNQCYAIQLNQLLVRAHWVVEVHYSTQNPKIT